MSDLVAKIENFLTQGTLETICGASVVYLAMDGDALYDYSDLEVLANSAVKTALKKITDADRKARVLEVLPQNVENISDTIRKEIEKNFNTMKSKLSNPTDSDRSLYDALKNNLVKYIDLSRLLWSDPEANLVLSERSIVEPKDNMKCDLPESIASSCKKFVDDFNKPEDTRILRNVVHNKSWKESVSDLRKRAERILSVLEEVWNNPAFKNSTNRKEQSEGTYIADIIMPLLRASLENMPNGESSRIVCDDTKKTEDEVKLWRETLDGMDYVNVACRPVRNQFGIIGIQIAGEDIYLNVLVNDAGGLSRYFHLCHAEIPLTPQTPWRVEPLVHLLLTLRNILIVNQSLLMQALEQAVSHPPPKNIKVEAENAKLKQDKEEVEARFLNLEQKDREKTDLIAKLKHDVSLIKEQSLQNRGNRYTDNASDDTEYRTSDSDIYQVKDNHSSIPPETNHNHEDTPAFDITDDTSNSDVCQKTKTRLEASLRQCSTPPIYPLSYDKDISQSSKNKVQKFMAEVSKNSSSSISNSNADNDVIPTTLNETESQPSNTSFTFLYEKLCNAIILADRKTQEAILCYCNFGKALIQRRNELASEKQVDPESNAVSRILNKEVQPILKSKFPEPSSGSDRQISCEKEETEIGTIITPSIQSSPTSNLESVSNKPREVEPRYSHDSPIHPNKTRLYQYAIEHGMDPEKFSIITEAEKN
ncbi:21807_t:CDS:10, partial [Gigaspora margarita]